MLLRLWYVSNDRVFELFNAKPNYPMWLQDLKSPPTGIEKAIFYFNLAQELFKLVREKKIKPLELLIKEGTSIQKGHYFTYRGTFYSKGFDGKNKTSNVSLYTKINSILGKEKLILEFSTTGLINNTAHSRLSGTTKDLFIFCSVIEAEGKNIRAVPYFIGDITERIPIPDGIDFLFDFQLNISLIDQFKDVDFNWTPSKEEFEMLKNIPEKIIKELFCELLSEHEVPNDWGGEECDIFSSNLSYNKERYPAAFLLKGPAGGKKFHKMTIRDCGKNGDQIYRLFKTSAKIFILQHCHEVSLHVRKEMEVYALAQNQYCKYIIIDGYDTARILHHYKKL